MKIEYKRLTEKEFSTFIDMRINQLREEGAREEIDLVPALKEYYIRHMADGTFVSWLAFDGKNIIGTSGMSFVEKPPYFGCPSGKLGLLSGMFTNPNYRRKGIAKELLSRVVNDAREYGCDVYELLRRQAAPKTLFKTAGSPVFLYSISEREYPFLTILPHTSVHVMIIPFHFTSSDFQLKPSTRLNTLKFMSSRGEQ